MCEDLQALVQDDIIAEQTPDGEAVEAVEAVERDERERDKTWERVLALCIDGMREYEQREWLVELDHQDALRNGRGGSAWTQISARRRQMWARSAASFGQIWQDLAGLDYIE
ncbi:hypothetical protein C8R44DRAFT_889555 [Mycena epipterygia]|nr:hypothetical protein C8R44DRAFT_889555 [Mycena epipterygia]